MVLREGNIGTRRDASWGGVSYNSVLSVATCSVSPALSWNAYRGRLTQSNVTEQQGVLNSECMLGGELYMDCKPNTLPTHSLTAAIEVKVVDSGITCTRLLSSSDAPRNLKTREKPWDGAQRFNSHLNFHHFSTFICTNLKFVTVCHFLIFSTTFFSQSRVYLHEVESNSLEISTVFFFFAQVETFSYRLDAFASICTAKSHH